MDFSNLFINCLSQSEGVEALKLFFEILFGLIGNEARVQDPLVRSLWRIMALYDL